MREIPLGDDLVAQVDDEDFSALSTKRWYVKRVHKTWHAFRYLGAPGRSKRITMHREVTGTPEGIYIYHLDGNGLNNQKANLTTQGHYNWSRKAPRRKGRKTTSAYIGVAWVEARQKWLAYIYLNGKVRHLGLHENELDAARQYDDAAQRFKGKDAVLNFPYQSERG